MATIRDIANGALRRIGVLDIFEDADAATVEIAVAAFNGLMFEAKLAGWITEHTAQGLGDTLALDDAYIEPLKAAVGKRIAPDFGKQIDRRLSLDAAMFHAQLAAHGSTAATFERGFKFESLENVVDPA